MHAQGHPFFVPSPSGEGTKKEGSAQHNMSKWAHTMHGLQCIQTTEVDF